MIEITEKAAEELRSLLESENKKDHSLRVFVAGMSCSGIQYGLALDNETKEGDVTVTTNDIKIVMTEDVSNELSGATIDFIDSEAGKGFVVDNPNAACGCGSCGGGCH